MKIATWNVNSLRQRLAHLLDWLKLVEPDVVGLQELKLQDEQFPFAELEAAGYHAVCNGQKSYNGVGIIARHPITDVSRDMGGFDDQQKRVIAATVNGVRVVNAYVVNGQSVASPKFEYKLRWLGAFKDYLTDELGGGAPVAVTGDFNIAPTPEDTHDAGYWAGKILCSDAERAAFRGLLELGLTDSFDKLVAPSGRFTWWDYRMGAFRRNLGLRIDHVLLSQPLAQRCASWHVDTAPRRLERPSDHAPVVAELGT
ncbi:MAG TPA: exodeoxyribonuclease III [Nevskiaceae bacterium]|nr:exodeoxyribonuclease III [Nevskiaceae bacterium]